MDVRCRLPFNQPLRISAINHLSINEYRSRRNEYKSRMAGHKWEEFLAFRPVRKLTTAYCGEPSYLNEEPCPQTDAQVTLCSERCSILRQWARRSWGICLQFKPLFPAPS